MKKLLILICILPLAAFAQMRIISQKNDGRGAIQSFSIKNRQQQSEVAGADKEKLFAVLMRWCNANFRDSIRVDTAGHPDTCRLSGLSMFMGSYTYHAESPNGNVAPVNFEVTFKFEVKVTGVKYVIALTHLSSHIINITGPNEGFENPTAKASQPYTQHYFETDINKLDAAINEQIDLDTKGLYKSAAKYIAKARKKGEL